MHSLEQLASRLQQLLEGGLLSIDWNNPWTKLERKCTRIYQFDTAYMTTLNAETAALHSVNVPKLLASPKEELMPLLMTLKGWKEVITREAGSSIPQRTDCKIVMDCCFSNLKTWVHVLNAGRLAGGANLTDLRSHDQSHIPLWISRAGAFHCEYYKQVQPRGCLLKDVSFLLTMEETEYQSVGWLAVCSGKGVWHQRCTIWKVSGTADIRCCGACRTRTQIAGKRWKADVNHICKHSKAMT